MTFELVSYENDFLDVTGKPLLLDVSPLLLLRIGSALVEEHPADTDKEDDVYPRYTERNFHGLLRPVRFIILIFCHSLLYVFL